jgi:sugar phosphate isomerase/epimerase
MKIGASTYCLVQAIRAGEMDVIDVIKWIADNGGEHVEIVPLGYEVTEKLLGRIVDAAKNAKLDISSYTFGADFVNKNAAELDAEIKRVKKGVDIAAALGTKLLRHDVAWRPLEEATLTNFFNDLPVIVNACREVADYAAQFGITTSIENHGFHVQSPDRVQKVIEEVGRANFKTTLDIGNFICANIYPLAGVAANAPLASMVHVKDFYIRGPGMPPGEGFGPVSGGVFIRGAIVGHGDIDIPAALRIIRDAGYDGYLSLEFEGIEECRFASKTGMDNIRKYLSML